MTDYEQRFCLECEWFLYEEGCSGYSEMTPGWDAIMRCELDIWEMEWNRATREDFHRYLRTARTCDKFEYDQDIDTSGESG